MFSSWHNDESPADQEKLRGCIKGLEDRQALMTTVNRLLHEGADDGAILALGVSDRMKW